VASWLCEHYLYLDEQTMPLVNYLLSCESPYIKELLTLSLVVNTHMHVDSVVLIASTFIKGESFQLLMDYVSLQKHKLGAKLSYEEFTALTTELKKD
jgi:hypothetical protein